MRIARRWLIPFGLAVLALGCDKSPVRPAGMIAPPGVRALDLNLSISGSEGSPGSPLTIEASIRNAGTVPVVQLQGGGPCQGISIAILDAEDRQVATYNPCFMPIPMCDTAPPFQPGASERTTLSFTGDTYRLLPGTGCERLDAPTGTYTAVVAFQVHWTASEPAELLERRVTFHWTAS